MSEELLQPPPKLLAHAMGPGLQDVQKLSAGVCSVSKWGETTQSGIATIRNNRESVNARCEEGL